MAHWYSCGIESSAITDDVKREKMMERILEKQKRSASFI